MWSVSDTLSSNTEHAASDHQYMTFRLLNSPYGSPSGSCFHNDNIWIVGGDTPPDRSYAVHGETRGFRPGYEQSWGRSRDSEVVEGEQPGLLSLVEKLAS